MRTGTRSAWLLSAAAVVVLLLLAWWLQDQRTHDAEPADRQQASVGQGSTPGKEAVDADGIPYVDLDRLPPEAAATVELIDAGGPFPHPGRDGSTFGNFEGLLPDRPRGYYAEYTVETPGLDHRGARRIVAGDGGELYWTADHYESFARIRR